jgi:hypothetical protein
MREFKVGDRVIVKPISKINPNHRAIIVDNFCYPLYLYNDSYYCLRLSSDTYTSTFLYKADILELDVQYYRELRLNKILG